MSKFEKKKLEICNNSKEVKEFRKQARFLEILNLVFKTWEGR